MSGSGRIGRSTDGLRRLGPAPAVGVKINPKSRARANGGPPPPKLAKRSIPTGSSSASRREVGSASVNTLSHLQQKNPAHQKREDQLQREKRRSGAKPQESQGRSDEGGKKKTKKKKKEKKKSGLLSFIRSI